MNVQINEDHKKDKKPNILSLRLNIVDIVTEDCFKTITRKSRHQQIVITPDKRKSLFEIYKQKNKKERKHKLVRLDTDSTEQTCYDMEFPRQCFSNKRTNPYNKIEDVKADKKRAHQQFLHKDWNIKSKLILLRQKILDSRMPCLNIRKLTRTRLETSPNERRLTLYSRKQPAVHQQVNKNRMLSQYQHTRNQNSISPALTPWLNSQVRFTEIEQLL